MKNRAFPYISIFLSLIICAAFGLIFKTSSNIVHAIISIILGLCVALTCLNTKYSENIESGNNEKWLNCIFLLENYDITDKSREIVVNYLKTVKTSDYSPPPIQYAIKLKHLLNDKGISEVNYSITDSLYIFFESFGLGVTTFGLCGMILTAISHFRHEGVISSFFWTSLIILALGVAISLFMVGDVSLNIIPSIVAGVISVGLIISLFSVNVARANVHDRQCDNIDIVISEKLNDSGKSRYNNGYLTSFNISVTNDKKDDILEMCGEMHIYNLQGKLLDASTVTIYGDIKSGETEYFVIDVDREYSEESVELYYSSADDLQITFKITYISFDRWSRTDYPDSRLMEILPLPDSSKSPDAISSVETKYLDGIDLYNAGQYEKAREVFLTIPAYKTSSEYIYLCEQGILEKQYAAIYDEAISLMNSAKYNEAIEKFSQIITYKESAAKIELCKERHQNNKNEAQYQSAQALYDKKMYVEAYKAFYNIKDYKDSTKYLYAILDDVDAVAESYIDTGDYSAAHDLLKSMGYNTSPNSDSYSKFMHICAALKSENYSLAASLGLTKIIIPNGITKIRSNAFKDCSTIVEIVIPESVTSIEEYAFKGCTSLEKLILPQGIKSIASNAFSNCDSLEKLVLPVSLESIGIYGLNSFKGEIHYEGTIAQWQAVSKSYSPVPLKKTVYCKDGNVNP